MTPCGMKFSTLAGTVGGGQQTPGFVGHSKQYIISPKFISADGGLARVVWMPKRLKDELAERLRHRAKEAGLGEDFVEKIADESAAKTEEEVLNVITQKGHPALSLNPMF
jgi:acetyl-CoA synthase